MKIRRVWIIIAAVLLMPTFGAVADGYPGHSAVGLTVSADNLSFAGGDLTAILVGISYYSIPKSSFGLFGASEISLSVYTTIDGDPVRVGIMVVDGILGVSKAWRFTIHPDNPDFKSVVAVGGGLHAGVEWLGREYGSPTTVLHVGPAVALVTGNNATPLRFFCEFHYDLWNPEVYGLFWLGVIRSSARCIGGSVSLMYQFD